MACEDRRADLTAYVDRELAPEKAQEFVAHLRTCASCAADVVDRLEWKRATQAAGRRHLPSAEFRERIERQVTAKERNGWFAAWAPAVAAVAATALFVLAATGWWRITEQRQVLRELADLHVTTLAGANPVDVVSSDRHTVKPWFAGRIPFTFDLPELAGTTFTLLGGRVVYASGEPTAQLLYQVRQHRLSVFIFQDRGGLLDRLLPEGVVSKRVSFTVTSWSDTGLRYVILSDVAPEDVQRLRELFRSAGRAH